MSYLEIAHVITDLISIISTTIISDKPVFCPVIVAPLHGEMMCSRDLVGGAYPKGTTCTFTCSRGSALHGSANTTCLQTGTWSSNPVTCQGKCEKVG